MEIKKKLTPHNYTAMAKKDNLYIVVHFVGAVSTAKNNADYLYNNNTSASAHYFVDENDIYQVVEDKNKAWHCGGGLQSNLGHTFYQKCTNTNSIGVELCCKIKNGDTWYFEDKTIENAIGLIRKLMDKHNIPIERVIRHFDVTGKFCPAPFIDEGVWADFKEEIKGGAPMTEREREKFNEVVKIAEKIVKENDILKQAIGWNSTNPDEPALYCYNDENIKKYVAADGNEVLGRVIASGKLAVDKDGKFAPMSKMALRLIIIQNR